MRLKTVVAKFVLVLGYISFGGPSFHAHAQLRQECPARFCPAANVAIAGSWRANLSITNLGTSDSLMSLSEAGGLVETDAIDLVDPSVLHSPGYGTVKATDCGHYDVSIVKSLYKQTTKQAETTVLNGSVVLASDGNSWSGQSDHQFYDASGQVVYTDTVAVAAGRILSSPTE